MLVLAVPGWDLGAKVPARTGAVNDGAGSHTIRSDRGADASSNGWGGAARYLKFGGSS